MLIIYVAYFIFMFYVLRFNKTFNSWLFYSYCYLYWVVYAWLYRQSL